MNELLDLIAILGAVDDAATGKPARVSDDTEDTADAEAPEPPGATPEPSDQTAPAQSPSIDESTSGAPHQGSVSTPAVEPDPEQREQQRQLARLVPVYRDRTNFGWFEAFSVREGTVAPSVRDALRELAEPTRSPAMLPRRLVAIALAARVFPARFGPVGSEVEVVLDAITIPGILKGLPPVVPPLPHVPPPPAGPPPADVAAAPPDTTPAAADDPNVGGDIAPPAADDPDGTGNYATADPEVQEQARALLTALADPHELTRLEDWHRFLDRFDHLVNPQLFNLPAPCSTTVVKAGGGTGGATSIQTDLCLAGADLKTVADGFLDWTRWKELNPWWCDMARADMGGKLPRYLEKVACSCSADDAVDIFDVAVFLDFARIDKGADRQLLTYKMSDQADTPVSGRVLRANGAVDVDEGVIELRRDGDHLRVATTKRVRFPDLDAAVVAVLACWVGYGDVGTEMILNSTGGAVRAMPCGGDTPWASTGLFSDVLALAHDYVSDAAAEAHRVLDRAGSGSYGVGDATEDARSTMMLALRGWQNLATTVLARPSAGSGETTIVPAGKRRLRSRVFSFDPPLPCDCSLKLTADLTSRHGDVAPMQKVTIAPTELKVGGRRFRLDVDAEDLDGGFFEGHVEASDPETNTVVAVAPVDVIVP